MCHIVHLRTEALTRWLSKLFLLLIYLFFVLILELSLEALEGILQASSSPYKSLTNVEYLAHPICKVGSGKESCAKLVDCYFFPDTTKPTTPLPAPTNQPNQLISASSTCILFLCYNQGRLLLHHYGK